MKKQPLLVHMIFHPDSGAARQLARYIHDQLNGDALVPGLRIPTVFCPVGDGGSPPPEYRHGFAERDFVVILADDHLTIDPAWCGFVGDLWDKCQPPSSRFLPIQLSDSAWPLDPRLNEVNFARAAAQSEGDGRNEFVVRRIVVELCRYLSSLDAVAESKYEAPVTLFLSHTKMDLDQEPQVIKALLDCLKEDQPIEAWVDSGDIQAGSKFTESIERGITKTSLLAVLTDNYASREWCREEILLAKEHQRPVVIIDALVDYESRSFPYLGNVPRIRWDGNPQRGIDLLLKETLRQLHASAVLEGSKEAEDMVFTRPPELATLVGLSAGTQVLYPDPPVGAGEMRRLALAKVACVTPLQRLAENKDLNGVPIALSMSESTDIERCGMDPIHLESCMLDLSRYLLIKGATLAYGGHLGAEGYTEKLFELVRSHNTLEGVEPFERIRNYRGWPLPRLSVQQLAGLNQVSTTVQVPRADDVDESVHADFLAEPQFFPAEVSPEHRFAWARGMTEMRALQADPLRSGVAARIVIGGTFGPTVKVNEDGTKAEKWYASRIPGVLEEILLSIRAGQPVFLIGAFGGVAKLVIDLIRGNDRAEATWDYQKGAPHAPEMRAIYEQRGEEWIGYPEIVSLIREKGAKGINPLLTDEEHEVLFDTVDPTRIIELVLRGLNRM
jgi:hypothetical protein